MKGKLIVIEGTSFSGKDYQTKTLNERLIDLGFKSIIIDFPRYDSPTGKIVGGPYLGKEEICKSYFDEGYVNVDPKIASLYYAADRKYNIDSIKKYLDEGYFVIVDRYTTSNLAYQGSKIIDKDERFNMYQWIDKLEYWLLELPKPDITILLHMPYEYSKKIEDVQISFEGLEKDEDYLKHAEKCYLELQQLYNWKYISCVEKGKIRSNESINNDILSAIMDINKKS